MANFNIYLGTAIISGVTILVFLAFKALGFPTFAASVLATLAAPLLMLAVLTGLDEWGR